MSLPSRRLHSSWSGRTASPTLRTTPKADAGREGPRRGAREQCPGGSWGGKGCLTGAVVHWAPILAKGTTHAEKGSLDTALTAPNKSETSPCVTFQDPRQQFRPVSGCVTIPSSVHGSRLHPRPCNPFLEGQGVPVIRQSCWQVSPFLFFKTKVHHDQGTARIKATGSAGGSASSKLGVKEPTNCPIPGNDRRPFRPRRENAPGCEDHRGRGGDPSAPPRP